MGIIYGASIVGYANKRRCVVLGTVFRRMKVKSNTNNGTTVSSVGSNLQEQNNANLCAPCSSQRAACVHRIRSHPCLRPAKKMTVSSLTSSRKFSLVCHAAVLLSRSQCAQACRLHHYVYCLGYYSRTTFEQHFSNIWVLLPMLQIAITYAASIVNIGRQYIVISNCL